MKKVCIVLVVLAVIGTSCGRGVSNEISTTNDLSANNDDSATKKVLSPNEVAIGKQVWMNANLNVDKFRNGDPIPEVKTEEEWLLAGKNNQPAWCYYDNDPANGEKYGKLYNWYAVNDPRGLAPVGYHIPTDAEWTEVENIYGTFLPRLLGGIRKDFSGKFMYAGEYGYWWSTTEYGWDDAYGRSLDYANVSRGDSHKESGLSVRCIKD